MEFTYILELYEQIFLYWESVFQWLDSFVQKHILM